LAHQIRIVIEFTKPKVTTIADVAPELIGVVAVVQHPPRGQPITGWARPRRRRWVGLA